MSEWNFMSPEGRENTLRAVREEAAGSFDLVSKPELWEAPTAAGQWEVRDQVGHLVDTTEGYFRAFDAARGNSTVPDALGVRHMNMVVDEGAFEPGDASAAPVGVDFDAASFVLTSYGRINAGSWRGDLALADRFRNLFFRI